MSPKKKKRRAIWKISPGRSARFWDSFRGQKIIAIGWLEELGDLRKINDLEEVKKLAVKKGYSQSAINQTWSFYRNVNIDDFVVAFGRSSLLDIGRVVGRYYYDDSVESYFDDENTYVHRRKADWFDVFPKPLDIKSDVKLYRSFRWPQDTIHEIVDVDVKRRITDFFSGKGITPSKTNILRAIEELKAGGKIKIRKDELFEKLVKIVEVEEKKKLKTNWQAETWKRIRELAERVAGE